MTDPADEGRRLQYQSLVALTVGGLLPVLVLSYVVHRYVLPTVETLDSAELLEVQGLLAFTALAMIAGSYTVWHIGRMVARMGELMGTARVVFEAKRKAGAVEVLTESLGAVLATMEEQANQVATLAARLEAANRELERRNAELSALSFRDPLTGLFNRRYFSLRLEEELGRLRRVRAPLAVVLLDLDGFKAVNDELGHQVGDAVLGACAQILRECSREIDVVARIGGDEFAVLLVETDEAGARRYADRLCATLAIPAGSADRRVTASVGVAAASKDAGETSDVLLRVADQALYLAKRERTHRVATSGSAGGS